MMGDRVVEDIRGDVAAWLLSLEEEPPRDDREAGGPDGPLAADLAGRAARCYARAGWWEDACRVYERAGDVAAAPLHERAQRFERAARAYEHASDWSNAVRCHLLAGDPGSAARCLIEAGKPLAAAWTLVDRLRSPAAARLVLVGVDPRSEEARAAVDLIRARCDALAGPSSGGRAGEEGAARLDGPGAARHLRRALESLRRLDGPDDAHRSLIDWALVIAREIGRPDLAASAHAAAVALGLDGAADRWASWARTTLGDTTGFPVPSPRRQP